MSGDYHPTLPDIAKAKTYDLSIIIANVGTTKVECKRRRYSEMPTWPLVQFTAKSQPFGCLSVLSTFVGVNHPWEKYAIYFARLSTYVNIRTKAIYKHTEQIASIDVIARCGDNAAKELIDGSGCFLIFSELFQYSEVYI